MRKLGFAAVGAFALAQSCCTPESPRQESLGNPPAVLQATSGPQESLHPCEQVGTNVHRAVMERLRPFGIYGSAGEASDESGKARADCYEVERVRVDCRGVRDRILSTARFFYDGRITSSPDPYAMEEGCLAGSGLVPEKEIRADCRRVRDNVFRETVPVLQEGGAGKPGLMAGRQARAEEKDCLAGNGLAPEEEENFASR